MNSKIKCMLVTAALILTSLFLAAPGAAAIQGAQAQRQSVIYACPMHADVKSAKQGKCPRCDMDLRAAAAEAVEATPSAGVGQLKAGQIPDTTVYDQDGRRLHFYSDLVKGKTVAINFIFTTCKTICPPLTATFRKLQLELGERAGRDVQLISISVDPTTDVPDRLKSFAAKFNAGPGWTFVTGSKPEIDSLLRALGAWAGDKNDHTPMILVGNDGTGYWTRAYGLASAGTLLKAVSEAASSSSAASGEVKVPMPQANNGAAVKPVEQGGKSSAQEKAAAYFTDTVLLTQDGKPVRFYSDLLKDKIVLINFIFTSCKGVCSPMTANLRKVQDYLGDRVGKDINMITITVDPATDVPDVLKKYSSDFKVKPGWHFLTGNKESIELILRKLGGAVAKPDEHSTVLLVGNMKTGEWVKMLAMLQPAQIADAVAGLASAERLD